MSAKNLIPLVVMVALAVAMATPLASADATSENVTKLQEGIVNTIATWVPFVVLFTLLGLAMAAIGIHLFHK